MDEDGTKDHNMAVQTHCFVDKNGLFVLVPELESADDPQIVLRRRGPRRGDPKRSSSEVIVLLTELRRSAHIAAKNRGTSVGG